MNNRFETAASAPQPHTYTPAEQTQFDPEKWSDARVCAVTGSYAYALDLPAIGMKMPGSLRSRLVSEPKLDGISENSIHEHLSYDGAIDIPPACLPKDGSSVLAVRYGEKFDNGQPGMLILRRDGSGLWSYKHEFGYMACGRRRKILDSDFSGAPITNPETADFKGLDQFAGYWAFPYAGVPFFSSVNIPAELDFGDFPAPEDSLF